METVTITLSFYQTSYELPRQYIREVLTGSLLADALQQEPEAKDISIDNSVVTPAAMELLVGLSKGTEPLESCPEALLAADYLNINGLIPYSDPYYGPIISRHPEDSKELLRTIIQQDRIWLFRYMETNRNWSVENWHIETAIGTGANQIFEYLVSHPKITVGEEHLFQASREGRVNFVEVLLNVPMRRTDDCIRRSLETAVLHGYRTIVDLLLPFQPPTSFREELLAWTARHGYEAIFLLLLTDLMARPNLNTSRYPLRGHLGNKMLAEAAVNGHLELVKLILRTMVYDVTTWGTEVLDPCVKEMHSGRPELQEILQLLLNHESLKGQLKFSDYVRYRSLLVPVPKCLVPPPSLLPPRQRESVYRKKDAPN